MSDIISKEEFEALFEAFAEEAPERPSGGDEAAHTESPDPARVLRPFEERRDRLEYVFDVFVPKATRQLSNLLRTSARLSRPTIRHMSYDEFASQLTSPSTLAVVEMSPLTERFVLQIEPSLAFPVVDRLLGGKGSPYPELRDLTDLEKRILTRFVCAVLEALSAAANLPKELIPEIETLHDAAAFIHCFDARKMVTSVSFTVEIGACNGTMRLCLSPATAELLCDPGATLASFRSAGDRKREGYFIRDVIGDVRVPVAAYFGKTTVTLNELASMRQGDLVLVGKKTHEGFIVTVHVGRRPKFFASLGVVGSKRAVRILGPLKRELGQQRAIVDRGGAVQGQVPYRDRDSVAAIDIPQFRAVDDTAFQHVDAGSLSAGTRRPRIYPDQRNGLPPDSADYEEVDQAEASAPKSAEHSMRLDHIRDIELDIAARLGSVELPLMEIVDLEPGSVVVFDRLTDAPVDLVLGERVVAQGEIVIVGEDYGIRITRTFRQ